MLQAFRTLGWQPHAESQVEAEALREQLGVMVGHGKLLIRLLGILAGARVLEADGKSWRVVAFDNAALDPTGLLAEIVAEYPEAEIERTLFEPLRGAVGRRAHGACGSAGSFVPRGRYQC